MKKVSKSKIQKKQYCDIIFVFSYINIDCYVSTDVYTPEEKKTIENIVKSVSQRIVIDKSYVQFPENKHEDVFILETGWNKLCKLVVDTNFGTKATSRQNMIMMESFVMMILCYLYMFLEKMGYPSDGISLEVAYKSKFMIEYLEDTSKEWKTYPGKWQTWYELRNNKKKDIKDQIIKEMPEDDFPEM